MINLIKRIFTLSNFYKFSFIFSVIIIFLSIISYHRSDSSFMFYQSDNDKIDNILGSFGANIASLFVLMLGNSSLIFIFLLVYFCFIAIKGIEIKNEIDRICGFISLFIFSSILFELYKVSFFDGIIGGGFLGNLISKQFETLIHNKKILSFSVNFIIFISLILIFRFSFIRFVKYALIMPGEKLYFKYFSQYFSKFNKMNNPIKKYINSLSARFNSVFFSVDGDELNEQLFQAEYAELLKNEFSYLNNENKIELNKVENNDIQNLKTEKENIVEFKSYLLPDLNIFTHIEDNHVVKFKKEFEQLSKILEEKLECFGIKGSVTSIEHGPVVTLFEYQPQMDSKISKITALEDDLAMALQTTSIRIIAPIPGKSVVGFEIANKQRKDVYFSTIVKSPTFSNFNGDLPLILGEDTIGNKSVVDLARMPHLLIAGSTGSGKSVALNSMIVSLLCKCKPDDLKLILIDPKRLEFIHYADIPHLLFPIITQAKSATAVLKWLVNEMEKRYEIMAQIGAKNIFDYNKICMSFEKQKFPFIVLIIDELADLMMISGKETEDLITRIAQMARASGIHMIVATQRPSVDIITGLIKVNFPSRISFKVTSKFDSRTILDCVGADKLLGKGDMLFLDSQSPNLKRVHGAYISDSEIAKVVMYVKSQDKPKYIELSKEFSNNKQELLEMDEELYNNIITFLKEVDEISISLLQRKFRIGYNRSARIIDMLESQGHILSLEGGKTRKVIKQQ